MIIKSADDKSKRLALLNNLKESPLLDARQLDWLRQELLRTQRGLQGEREAAHCLDSHFKDSDNHALLHDLRLEVDGEVAQIDHLVITRGLRVILFETKCYTGNVQINEHGEFSVSYAGERTFGVPSPLEQSRRHERLLLKVLAQLQITGRLGTQPQFVHAVLLHPKAIITRPDHRRFNTDNVIKADQISSWHQRQTERALGAMEALTLIVNIRGTDTLKTWATQLAAQHRPANLLALPEFMAPRPQPAQPRAATAPASAPAPAPMPAPAPTTRHAIDAPPEHLRRKLVCVACQAKISFAEGRFCWNNDARFGGFQYCRPCQTEVNAAG